MPKRFGTVIITSAVVLLAAAASALPASAAPRSAADDLALERVSVTSAGTQAMTGGSNQASPSRNGDVVSFLSGASDLVPGDTNDARDVFVRDLITQTTTRVSVATDGAEANGRSDWPKISPDGRYVTFSSEATNLAPGAPTPPNSLSLFLHDRRTGTTVRLYATAMSMGFSGAASFSADGRTLVFETDTAAPGQPGGAGTQIYTARLTADLRLDAVRQVTRSHDGSRLNGSSSDATISADGRFVVYDSEATNLVAGTSTGRHVYRTEIATGTTVRVDPAPVAGRSEAYRSDISKDGRFVSFDSAGASLVAADTDAQSDIYLRDLQTGELQLVSDDASDVDARQSSLADDGSSVVFVADDRDGMSQVWVRDTRRDSRRQLTVGPGGASAHDRSWEPRFAADAGTVTFSTDDDALVAGDTNRAEDVVVASLVPRVGPPKLVTERLPVGAVDRRYDTAVEATGAGPISYAVVDGELPAGLRLVDDRVVGTPTAEGTVTVDLSASNRGGADDRSYTIEIGVAPTIVTTSLPDLAVGREAGVDLIATGTPSLSWRALSGLPSGMRLSGDGRLTGAATTSGVVSLRVQVTNRFGSTEGSVRFDVTGGAPQGGTDAGGPQPAGQQADGGPGRLGQTGLDLGVTLAAAAVATTLTIVGALVLAARRRSRLS